MINESDRICFYGDNDLMFKDHLKKVRERIDKLNKTKLNFIDVLELQESIKYVKASMKMGLYESFFELPQEQLISDLNKTIAISINSIETSEIINYLRNETLNFEYSKSVWDVLFNFLDKWTDSSVKELFKIYSKRLSSPMSNKGVVNKYGIIIMDYLFKESSNAKLLLRKNITLPRELSKREYNALLYSYIKDDDVSFNFLKEVIGTRTIDIELRNMALEKLKMLEDKILKNQNNFIFVTKVAIDENNLSSKKFKIINSDSETSLVINGRILMKKTNWNQIMCNFKTFFKFINNEDLISAVHIPKDGSLIDLIKYFGNEDSNSDHYQMSTVMETSDRIYLQIFMTYYHFLKEKGICFENILKWFVKKEPFSHYGISKFDIIFMDENSWYSKTLMLLTQLHRFIRTYYLVSKYGNFDLSLIDNFSNTPKFSDLCNIGDVNYFVLKDEKLIKLMNLAFSTQSDLALGKSNFFDTVFKGDLKYNSLNNYQREAVDQLIEYSFVYIEKEIIRLSEPIILLRYQYYFGVIPNLDYNSDLLKLWEEEKLVEPIRTLLTPEENNYYDYFFSSKFVNGEELRNKYAHGAANSFSEDEHMNNYFRTLYMFTMLILKVDTELNKIN